MDRHYFIDILTNAHGTVLYTSVTGDLLRRVGEHKTKRVKGYTQKYNINRLVYVEMFHHVADAIAREE